jgi:hypothetical protein
MHLVDGNNLSGRLWGDPRLRKETLSLVLDAYRGRRKRAVLFFDGPADAAVPREETSLGNVRVLLSPEGRADARILDWARRHPGAVVVTDDRALAQACRKARARVVSPRDFLEGSRP